ncbi:unnamed protein product [Diplocarpon coronariae]|uniref:Secondary alcohol dehydrogenase n=1 Tax=Diplocarpon coronariae TaxID=2795749 RepID=A0A218Z6Y4_9HELO|nr:hypothetical protein JHW43_002229 [Diplocarpon mali]OWP02946.1 hypothetical protein B2J93_3526 [Marssonina coronariae]
MPSDTTPISTARFAKALKSLPLSTLHLKAMELRNSIAHLDYSNEQLRPFAAGTEPSQNGTPDPDCADAIRENEIVIARQMERIELLRKEVEGRGNSWTEFQSAEEVEKRRAELNGGEEMLANGTGGEDSQLRGVEEGRSSAWNDGTIRMGRIVDGEIRMEGEASGVRNGAGGGLDDETLRRAMEQRMRALAEEEADDEGVHL